MSCHVELGAAAAVALRDVVKGQLIPNSDLELHKSAQLSDYDARCKPRTAHQNYHGTECNLRMLYKDIHKKAHAGSYYYLQSLFKQQDVLILTRSILVDIKCWHRIAF